MSTSIGPRPGEARPISDPRARGDGPADPAAPGARKEIGGDGVGRSAVTGGPASVVVLDTGLSSQPPSGGPAWPIDLPVGFASELTDLAREFTATLVLLGDGRDDNSAQRKWAGTLSRLADEGFTNFSAVVDAMSLRLQRTLDDGPSLTQGERFKRSGAITGFCQMLTDTAMAFLRKDGLG